MFKNLAFVLLAILVIRCTPDSKPKPKGDLRLDYPNPKYQQWNNHCTYTFEYSDFAQITDAKKTCWYYLRYPKMKANVLITYFPVKNNTEEQIKEVEKMVYKHTIRASAIETKTFSYPKNKVYGNMYELKGETASNIQIFVTDSTKHFVTANLYFNTRPKPDSLAPAVEYIKRDLIKMIETFRWKKE